MQVLTLGGAFYINDDSVEAFGRAWKQLVRLELIAGLVCLYFEGPGNILEITDSIAHHLDAVSAQHEDLYVPSHPTMETSFCFITDNTLRVIGRSFPFLTRLTLEMCPSIGIIGNGFLFGNRLFQNGHWRSRACRLAGAAPCRSVL